MTNLLLFLIYTDMITEDSPANTQPLKLDPVLGYSLIAILVAILIMVLVFGVRHSIKISKGEAGFILPPLSTTMRMLPRPPVNRKNEEIQ